MGRGCAVGNDPLGALHLMCHSTILQVERHEVAPYALCVSFAHKKAPADAREETSAGVLQCL